MMNKDVDIFSWRRPASSGCLLFRQALDGKASPDECIYILIHYNTVDFYTKIKFTRIIIPIVITSQKLSSYRGIVSPEENIYIIRSYRRIYYGNDKNNKE